MAFPTKQPINTIVIYDQAGNEIAVATEATLEAARVLLASLDGKDYATQTTLATRASETTLAAVQTLITSIKDTDGIKKITDPLPAGTNEVGKVAQGTKAADADGWPIVIRDASGNAVTITEDAGVYRLEISGKVQVTGAVPPPATTPAQINADTPLVVGSDDTTFIIPNGETFHLQEVIAGNEDPTKGAVIEVIFDDGTEHLIARVYTNGQTVSIGYADVSEARDGTALLGNGVYTIIVRRAKFTGTNIAIDAVVSGYTV